LFLQLIILFPSRRSSDLMGLGQLFFGPWSDAIGRKTPLLLGLVTYIGASIWAALALNLESLIFARALQGIGASMAIVVVMSMVRSEEHTSELQSREKFEC